MSDTTRSAGVGTDGAQREERSPPPRGAEAVEHSRLRAFRFDHSGIRRVLGSLEADVLEAVWFLTPDDEAGTAGWTTIGAVCQRLGPPAHYKTIQTVMNRLVEKQLLARRLRQRAFAYRARVTRQELEVQVTRSVVEGLVRDFGQVAIAQLVEAISELRPDQLALLERLAGQAVSATGEAGEPRTPAGGLPPAERGESAGGGGSSRQEPGA
jgi:predicted transcriptional regulator